MAVLIQIPDQKREDMLVGALEGGSNYWCYIPEKSVKIIEKYGNLNKDPFSTTMWKAIKAGEIIPIHDIENRAEELGKISLLSIDVGEQLMAEKSLNHFTDMINETGDAITADVWFQYCVLKEIVYG